jgi:hypothetical protein
LNTYTKPDSATITDTAITRPSARGGAVGRSSNDTTARIGVDPARVPEVPGAEVSQGMVDSLDAVII